MLKQGMNDTRLNVQMCSIFSDIHKMKFSRHDITRNSRQLYITSKHIVALYLTGCIAFYAPKHANS